MITDITETARKPKPRQRDHTDECARIAKALEENGWHQTRAVAHLGMDRATLYRKVRTHGPRKHT